MTARVLFAPAGEVGSLDRDGVAETIDRALGEVDYSVNLGVHAGAVYEIADVGGALLPLVEEVEGAVTTIACAEVGESAGEVGAVGGGRDHENTVAIGADPVCVNAREQARRTFPRGGR